MLDRRAARGVRAVAVLALAMSIFLPGAAAASWILDADVAVVYETNVGFSPWGRYRVSDTSLVTSASAGRAFYLDDRNIISVTGDVTGTAYDRLRGLTNVAFGGTTTYRHKFGVGAGAPWARFSASGGRQQYDIDERDAWRYRVALGVGKRFGERLDLSAEYAYDERVGDHGRRDSPFLPGDGYDANAQTYSFRADVLVTEIVSASLGYALREGEVIASTPRDRTIGRASNALAIDRAFGSGWVTYPIDATVHIFTAGLTVALGRRWSANAGYEYQYGDAWRRLEYHNDVFRVGVSYRY
jgi:hypothetical protein